MSVVLLFAAVGWRLRLVGERHDGCGGVGGGGVVLGVGEAVQVFTSGIYSAVDRTFGGATHAVLLCLVQVVGDTGFYTVVKVRLNTVFLRLLALFSNTECLYLSPCSMHKINNKMCHSSPLTI